MEIVLDEPKHTARHAWLHPSGSLDILNWSLIAAVDRQLPSPGIFAFEMPTEKLHGTIDRCAMRFPDDQFEEILKAARLTRMVSAPFGRR